MTPPRDDDDDDELDAVVRPDEAFSLDAFKRECERELDAFTKLHGRAFLLLERASAEGRLTPPARPSRTLASREEVERTTLPPSKYLVFPVRKTERSLIARFYSVGQTRNNDVVIRDVSVSKSHALFQDDDDGGFTLMDARSTNGTFVNDVRVPQHGSGDPVKVRTSDQLRFGNVQLTFMVASVFRDLVRVNSRR